MYTAVKKGDKQLPSLADDLNAGRVNIAEGADRQNQLADLSQAEEDDAARIVVSMMALGRLRKS